MVKRYADDIREKVFSLREQGASYEKIATLLGLHRNTVIKWLAEKADKVPPEAKKAVKRAAEKAVKQAVKEGSKQLSPKALKLLAKLEKLSAQFVKLLEKIQ